MGTSHVALFGCPFRWTSFEHGLAFLIVSGSFALLTDRLALASISDSFGKLRGEI